MREVPVSRRTVTYALMDALREQASRGLMFHQAVTERLGLGPTDMKALDLARNIPELTAGRLAQVTGLSASATTAVLDRLERRGFVRRRRDPVDRRRIVVEVTGQRNAQVEEIFEALAEHVLGVLAEYDEKQLDLLLGFVSRLNRESAALTRALTEGH